MSFPLLLAVEIRELIHSSIFAAFDKGYGDAAISAPAGFPATLVAPATGPRRQAHTSEGKDDEL
jgi:hypothetical protein